MSSPDEAGMVDMPTNRNVAFSIAADCDLDVVTALVTRHPAGRHYVVMAASAFDATDGTVDVRTVGKERQCMRGPQHAEFGCNGTHPLPERRSGNGTTPAGVVPLDEVTACNGQSLSMFGNRADPHVHVPYRSVRREDWCGATTGTGWYQHPVSRPGWRGPDDEWLASFGEACALASVIGAALEPISGDDPDEVPYATAIFLHRTSYTTLGTGKPTSGCVSLGDEDLFDTLRAIDPDLDPHFAIGPRDWLIGTA